MPDRELYGGMIRLHILHHAERGPVYGVWIMEELARHGYRLSPGTLYPMLHTMEAKGHLRSTEEVREGRVRRIYSATTSGRKALEAAKLKVQGLFGELFEGEMNGGNRV
jgi:PadR family transcriptional regulator, regulatory protein PadR